jgi:hypothetical protein
VCRLPCAADLPCDRRGSHQQPGLPPTANDRPITPSCCCTCPPIITPCQSTCPAGRPPSDAPCQVYLAADRLVMEGLLAEALQLLRAARPRDSGGAAALLELAGEAAPWAAGRHLSQRTPHPRYSWPISVTSPRALRGRPSIHSSTSYVVTCPASCLALALAVPCRRRGAIQSARAEGHRRPRRGAARGARDACDCARRYGAGRRVRAPSA